MDAAEAEILKGAWLFQLTWAEITYGHLLSEDDLGVDDVKERV